MDSKLTIYYHFPHFAKKTMIFTIFIQISKFDIFQSESLYSFEILPYSWKICRIITLFTYYGVYFRFYKRRNIKNNQKNMIISNFNVFLIYHFIFVTFSITTLFHLNEKAVFSNVFGVKSPLFIL